MNVFDLISSSVIGAHGCDMDLFVRYFPAAQTMYDVFVALAIGLILLNWIWNLFKNFGIVAGLEVEDPLKLTIRSVLVLFLVFYSGNIVDIALDGDCAPLTMEKPGIVIKYKQGRR